MDREGSDMTAFKFAIHGVTGEEVVEVWVDGLFRAVIYPHSNGIQVLSRYVESVVKEDRGDGVVGWEFVFNRKMFGQVFREGNDAGNPTA
jgi:hypothetical protein